MKKEQFLISVLKEELNELKKLQLELLPSKAWEFEGTLNLSKKKNKPQYYIYSKADGKRKYIPQKDIAFIKKLAQKAYEKKLSALIEERSNLIERLLTKYKKPLENYYYSLCDDRRALVDPRLVDDEAFIKQWYEKTPGSQNTYPFTQSFLTNRGEKVRSKSEKIIADLLYQYKIPYIYEPMIIVNCQYCCPDFLILNVSTREEIIYEHLGMADDAEYMQKAAKKINNYQSNGYTIGKNLLLSMETKNVPIDIGAVEKMILEFLS